MKKHKKKAAAVPPAEQPRPALKVSDVAVALARVRGNGGSTFTPYQPAPGVMPAGEKIAMDDAYGGALAWAQQNSVNGQGPGQSFIGYPELALLAQIPEYRKLSEIIAFEMTRAWIEFTSTGEDEDKSDKIKQIEAEFTRLKVQHHFRRAAEQDGFFGRSHIYIDTGATENPAELETSIGNGLSAASEGKVGPGAPILRLKTVEAVWTYPMNYNSNNPLARDWYKPTVWYVQGTPIHASRLLTFIGREVPDLLKPAYSFGGLSMTQMSKVYVSNWQTVRDAVKDLIKAFSIMVLKTDMTAVLSGGGAEDLYKRLDVFNQLRSNRGVFAINNDTEEFSNVSAPLGGLHELQSQSQEHMAAVSGIPLVKLLGIQPAGLNASSEGELDCFETLIGGYQEALFRENLDAIFHLVQLSLWGKVDPDIIYSFKPLSVVDEVEKATIRKTNAETAQIHIDSGVISPAEERARVAAEKDSGYASLDADELPDLNQEEDDGLVIKGGSSEGGEADSGDDPAKDEHSLPFGQDDAHFEESKHPRAANGKFGSGGGSSKQPAAKTPHLTTSVVDGNA